MFTLNFKTVIGLIILNNGVLLKLKKILYYISDHGKGHATRSIAIIRELQKRGMNITVRNSNCERFIKKALPNVPESRPRGRAELLR